MLTNRILFYGATCVLTTTIALSQSTSQLSGTVSDTSGAVIAGAVVSAIHDETGSRSRQVTTDSGLFAFASIPVGPYTITVEMPGFKTARRTGATVAVNTPLTVDFVLQLGDAQEVVKVEATAEAIQTTAAVLGNVVERRAIVNLPLNGRNPLNLIVLEPGVTQRSGTAINVNGSRANAVNVTIDGIEANESSNPTPTNNVHRLNPDNVQEFKVTTSNPTPEEGRNSGASVSIATRAGTNEFHGTMFEFFRNSALNSNEFFANAQGNEKADVKLNQYGFEVSGPIRKNKTFFFASWQGQKVNFSQAIDKAFDRPPNVYTPEALAGIFRYFRADPNNPLVLNGTRITTNSPALVDPATGALAPGVRNCATSTDLNCVAAFNMFGNDPRGIGPDSSVMRLLRSYPAPNSYAGGDGLNVANYFWNTSAKIRGPHQMIRVDHIINDANTLFYRVMWAEQSSIGGDLLNNRPAIFPGFPPRGEVYRPSQNHAFSWRTVISPRVVNEFTAGYARFSFLFTYAESNPLFPNLPAFSFNNVDTDFLYRPRSERALNTPQLIDNLTWVQGAHVFKFGVNMRFYQQNDRSGSVGNATVTPAISLSGTIRPPVGFNTPGVASSTAAGIASQDNSRLLGTINDLMGIPAQLRQAFLGDLGSDRLLPLFSGDNFSLWVLGQRLKQYNFYAQDEWKLRRNLTLTYGLRWEINMAPTEAAGRVYVPDRAIDGSQGPVSFVKSDRWFNRNNLGAFAPRLAIAWMPGSDSRTVIRAGWGMAFDPMATFQAAAVANSVPGQVYTCTSGVNATPTQGCASVPDQRLSEGFPSSLNPPDVRPSSFLTLPAATLLNAPAVVVFNPNLKIPTTHQWNITIQRELPGGYVVQAGYIGRRAMRLFRGWDINQIQARPILPSFLAMQQNLNAGCAPSGSGCPAGVTAAAVPLVRDGVVTAAFVNSSATITNLRQNAAGELAGRIEQTTMAAGLRPNPQFGTVTFLDNGADSNYHSAQLTVRKRFDAGLMLGAAYTLGKSMDNQSSDPVGTSYAGGLSANGPVDYRNMSNERARSDFDQRQVLNVTWLYELPVGTGKPLFSGAPRAVNQIIGGWAINGMTTWQSGEPYSIRSGIKTHNYSTESRAALVGELPEPVMAEKPGTVGPVYFMDASAFKIPDPGQVGMGRNIFNGPSFWNVDLGITKAFAVTERLKLTFRGEMFNAFNHANFRKLGNTSVGSAIITNPNFGTACCQTMNTATSTAVVQNGEAFRVVQLALKLQF